MTKRICILIMMVLFASTSKALLYRSFQTIQGLSHNSVWSIIQDSKGFIWFGTNDGLNRFDGVNFKIFRRRPGDVHSIGSNFIHCMLEIDANRILVGTKEGLYLLHYNTESFSYIPLADEQALSRTSVHSLVFGKNGDVWVGSYGRGIFCLNKDMKVVKHYDASQIPSLYINTIAFDRADNLCVGTDGMGLFVLNITSDKVSKTKLSTGSVQSIYCDNSNHLWIGATTTGLVRYDYKADDVKVISDIKNSNYSAYNIKAITEYDDKTLVMSSENGLLKLDLTTEQLYCFDNGNSYDNLMDNSIFAIAKDREAGLWLGTYFYGVNYYSPLINEFSYYTVNSGTTNKCIIKRIAKGADGCLWMSTRNSGLVVFNPSTKSVEKVNVLGVNTNIQELMVDENELWVNEYNKGLYLIQLPQNKISKLFTVSDGLPSNIVNSLFKSSRKNIYIGTTKGACIYNGKTFTPIPQLKGISVMRIIEDFKGNIWFATHLKGLYRISPEGLVTNFRQSDKSFKGNNINYVFQDSKGNLWIGSEGEGLSVVNSQNCRLIRRFDENNGFISNIIYSIQEDTNGNIWVSTGNGLVRLASGNYHLTTYTYIEQLLGLHYTHSASVMGNNGQMFFGGSNGFICFNPSNLLNPEKAPEVCLTDLYINGQRITPPYDGKSEAGNPLSTGIGCTEKIELASSQSTFSFDVAALSYLTPDIYISYKLEGFDKEWKLLTPGNRHILYMNLPSGKYKMQVRASYDNITWCEPVVLGVTVNPPFLLSKVMLFIYVVLGIFLLFYAFRRYRARLYAANQERMLKFSMAKDKELYDSKIGFFTNIAHEIRTPLSLISAPLDSIIASGEGSERTRNNLQIMRDNVGRLLELINQLLDFRKVDSKQVQLKYSHVNVSDELVLICRRYEEFCRLHNISLDVKGINPSLECNIDAEAFRKIAGNLLSNAMKFTNTYISVSLEFRGDMLRMVCKDDGIGIRESEQDKIFESFYQVDDNGTHPGTGLGLPMARTLAKMHNGNLYVESQYGCGSSFILEIPTDLQASSEVIETNTVTPAEPSSLEQVTTSKITVLVVEDNAELRSFICENMGSDYRLFGVANGREAIEILAEHHVDIIVSDIMMPEMDGIELSNYIKNSDLYSHIPVILLSARTDVETKVHGLNIGADAYLEKPFSLEQLQAQVNSIIANRERVRENFKKSPLDYYKKVEQSDIKEKENAEFVDKLNAIILENLLNSDFNIDSLSRLMYMSRSNLHKRVKGITGMTPNDYIRLIRLNRAAELLSTGKYQVVEVCYRVGFNTPSYFSKCFNEHFGMLPKEFMER